MENSELMKHILVGVNNCDDAILITNASTDTIIYANKPWIEGRGFSEEEIIGKPVGVIQNPNIPQELFNEIYDSTMLNGSWEGEIEDIRKDGTTIPVYLKTTKVIDESSNHELIIGVTRDISNLISREKAATFLSHTAGISIENLRMGLDNLLDTFGKKGLDDYAPLLLRLKTKCDNIEKKIDEFKSLYSRRFNSKLMPRLTNLTDLIKNSIQNSNNKPLNIRLNKEEYRVINTPHYVICDRSSLSCAIDNIVGNSLRHSQDYLIISYSTNNGITNLRVYNDGPSLSDSEKNGVFVPGNITKEGNLSFGLYANKEILKFHKGFVQIISPAPMIKDVADGSSDGVAYELSFGVNLDLAVIRDVPPNFKGDMSIILCEDMESGNFSVKPAHSLENDIQVHQDLIANAKLDYQPYFFEGVNNKFINRLSIFEPREDKLRFYNPKDILYKINNLS